METVVTTVDEFLQRWPRAFDTSYHSVAGSWSSFVHIYYSYDGENWEEFDQSIDSQKAGPNSPGQEEHYEAPDIRYQISRLPDFPKFFKVICGGHDDFEGELYTEASYFYAVPLVDFEKLRRRIRDILNKTSDKSLILSLAIQCKVKLD